ncbi:protein ALP1-like, partial [Odontomachus brunneus]|uniref:protein ALP1-like n=1 Tax=Odontomachus brunneus TaxID=486640 RepID=UPI0013F1A0EF
MEDANRLGPALQRTTILNGVVLILKELDYFTSSESEDEMENLTPLVDKRKLPKLENYVENIVPAYNNHQFKSHFRINRDTFEYIFTIIAPRLKRISVGLPMISPEKQFLIALWCMATPDSYRSICEKFDPSRNSVNEVWTGFEATSGFPKVIGAIDGTHINIPVPLIEPVSYINCKGHYSIQLQAVCDHRTNFIHCYVGHPGSVHDQRVFRLSELQQWLGDPDKFPQNCHILGDAAYKLHENVIVPYRDNGHLTIRQRNFNFCHSSSRIAIERAFGLLKTRFRTVLN